MTGTTIDTLKEIDASRLDTKSDLMSAFTDLKVEMVKSLLIPQVALAGFHLAAIKLVK